MSFDPSNPNSLRQDVVDEYFGTKVSFFSFWQQGFVYIIIENLNFDPDTLMWTRQVADPYRWLEDPDAENTKKWVEAQNKITNAFLEKIEDRQFLKEKLTEKYNYVKTGCSWKSGKGAHASYYFYKNDGLQNQYVLMRQKTLDSDPTVFFDPNTLAADGTKSLGATSFSDSGRYWAYGVSASGSDWQTIHVRDTTTDTTLEDRISWVKFSGISWLKDDSGFFYNRYPEPVSLSAAGAGSAGDDEAKIGSETDANVNMAVYLHILGEPQARDRLVYRTPDYPKWMFGAQVTDDGNYLILTVSESTAPVNRVFTIEVPKLLTQLKEKPGEVAEVTKVVDNFDAGSFPALPLSAASESGLPVRASDGAISKPTADSASGPAIVSAASQ